jgi:MOSC domain-containing protein YiiM
MNTPHLLSIQTGRIETHPGSQDGKYAPWASAFCKTGVVEPIRLTRLGLEGDEHEYEHHGGPDKAVLLYGVENYLHWNRELGRNDMGPGGFGENFTVSELLESNVCIGDVVRIGEVLLEVTQPRVPCSKISRRWNMPTLTKLTEQTGRTGWYARVLREGMVEPGPITLVDRPYPEWTIDRIREIQTNRRREREEAARLAACPALSEAWRAYLV